MSNFISLHGRLYGLGPTGPLFKGRPVGNPVTGRGRTWYVDSQIDRGSGESPDDGVGTVTELFTSGKVTANKGDVIVCMPGHVETLSAAAGVAHSVAGVSVIGLGYGANRPTFTLATSTAASYAITAADAFLQNLVFVGNLSNLVTSITTTKKGTWIDNCEWQNAGTNLDFLTPIKALGTTTADNDDLRVTNCRWHTIDSDDTEFINIAGTLNRFVCQNNWMVSAGTASPLIKVAAGKLLLGADIGWNRCINAMTANELFISNDGTTNTGIIHNNYVGHADVTGTHDPGWDAGGFRLFNNLSSSVDNLSGVLIPAADVNL